MRKYFLTSIAVLPLLLSFSHAAQSWSVDPPAPPLGFPSEDSGTSSYLGVDISDVTSERLSALKLKEEKGVEVTMVDQDAPAGKAGFKEHDVILAMNGTPIESEVQIKRMIRETPPGRVVTFDLSRDGQPMTIKVQLADKRKQFAYAPKAKEFHIEIPPMPNLPDFDMGMNVVVVHSSARSGLAVENITPQLGEFFGIKNGNGVLIRSVEKGSRAEKAGFRAGDVIVKVNDQPVHDTSDFTHALRSRNGGSINVGVIRDKKEQNLNLTLPERKESGDTGEMLEEESLDLDAPMLDAETQAELSEVQDEIAKVGPQIELATQETVKASKEVRNALCTQQRQMSQQVEKFKKEFQPKVQEQLKNEQKKLKNEMDQLRHEIQRELMDI